jgi:hypothetical protein
MALWKVKHNGKEEIVYSDGALNLPGTMSQVQVTRHTYEVPYTNVGKGGFMMQDGKKIHTPSWTEVHPETTFEDIVVQKNPFEELFVEEKKWTFKSASSSKEYTVRYNAKGNLSCDCWGYIAHRKCKHIREIAQQIVA